MPSWRNRFTTVATGAVLAVSVAYPFALYFGREHLASQAFVAIAMAMIGLRLMTLRKADARRWRWPLLICGIVLLLLLLVNPPLAAKSYPSLLSVGATALFAWSLRHPPSVIEQFARLGNRDLPPEAQHYCRRVTIVWVLWLATNASVATALALWGSVAAWTLWTGVVFYALSGALFAAEYLVRSAHMRRSRREQ